MDMHNPETNSLKLTGTLAGLAGCGYWLFPKLLTRKFGIHLLVGSRVVGQSLVALSIFLGVLWKHSDVATRRVTLFACICMSALAGVTSVNMSSMVDHNWALMYIALLCFLYFFVVFMIVIYGADKWANKALFLTTAITGVLGCGFLVAGRRLLRELNMSVEYLAVLNGEVELTLGLVAGIIILTDYKTKRASLIGSVAWYAIFCMSSAQYYIQGDQTHMVLLLINTGGLFYSLKALSRPPKEEQLLKRE